MTLLHSPSRPSLLRERRETTIATVGVWMQCARRKAGPPQYVCKGIRIRGGREGGQGGQGIKFKSRVERVSQRAASRDQLSPSTGCRSPIQCPWVGRRLKFALPVCSAAVEITSRRSVERTAASTHITPCPAEFIRMSASARPPRSLAGTRRRRADGRSGRRSGRSRFYKTLNSQKGGETQ